MLRRRFMLGDSVPKYPYTITVGYYANEEIPFLGGYKYTPEMEVTTLGNSKHICKFSLLLSTYDSTIGYGEYTISSESNGLGIVGRLSQDDSYPLTEYVGGLFGGVYLNDAGAYYLYDVSDKISAVILDGLISALSLAWHGLTSSPPNYDVTLPDSILYLGKSSLWIDVPTITIPKSVQYMDECLIFPNPSDADMGSLFSCLNLKPCTPPSLGASKSIFILQDLEVIRPDFKIRVYTDCLDTYKNDTVWGQYSDLYDTINNTIVYYNTNGRQLLEQLNDFINVSSNSKLNTAISIYLPNSVTSIGERAFSGCSSLKSITIPNSVTSIGQGAFGGCFSLTLPVYNAHCFAYMPTSYSGAYAIPEGIEQIAGGAFQSCSKLTSITIPDGVTSIEDSVFRDCSNLMSVTIPNSVTIIKNSAFYYCSSLPDIVIPNNVTSIGNYAFYYCSKLTSVVWNAKHFADVSSFSYSPFSGIRSQITSFTFGDSVEHIPAYLCYGMDNLKSINIPNSVESIGGDTFAFCSSLRSVTIGNSVESIGERAFSGCSSLTAITYQGTITQWEGINLGNAWKHIVPATVVHCTDGDVEL